LRDTLSADPTEEKNLTRRANHRHLFIITAIKVFLAKWETGSRQKNASNKDKSIVTNSRAPRPSLRAQRSNPSLPTEKEWIASSQ
jgi:hypothetical protein